MTLSRFLLAGLESQHRYERLSKLAQYRRRSYTDTEAEFCRWWRCTPYTFNGAVDTCLLRAKADLPMPWEAQ